MKIFKSYGFWTAFAGAVVILVNSLGELFGFKIESKLIENVILAVAGVLVALGVVSMNGKDKQEGENLQDKTEESETQSQEETKQTITQQQDKEEK